MPPKKTSTSKKKASSKKATPSKTKRKKTPNALKRLIDGRLTSKLGKDTVQPKLSDPNHWFRTGCPALDVAITGKVGKGLPSGRVCEIYGEESVGKTTLGACIMRDAQNQGGLAYMIDSESTFSTKRAKQLGLDLDMLTYVKEMYLEPILDGIDIIVSGAQDEDPPVVVFWDTIAGTPSQKERGRATGDHALGIHARALSAGLRKFVGKLSSTKVLVLACNQLKLGDMTNPYTAERVKDSTLGGKAIKFHADVRIKLVFVRKTYDTKQRQNGFEVRASIIKNKHGPEGVRAILIFRFDNEVGHIDNALSVLHTLMNWEGQKMTNKNITFDGKKTTIGTFVRKYNNDPEFKKRALRRLEEAYQEEFIA